MKQAMVLKRSMVGRSHTEKGSINEDRAEVIYRSKDLSILMVSDGVGSEPYGGVGASILCSPSMGNIIKNSYEKHSVTDIPIEKISENIIRDAQSLIKLELNSLGIKDWHKAAATMACVIIDYKRELVHVIVIGDSPVMVLNNDSVTRIVQSDLEGSSTWTPFTSSPEMRIKSFDLNDIKTIFMCTDGVDNTIPPENREKVLLPMDEYTSEDFDMMIKHINKLQRDDATFLVVKFKEEI